MELTLNLYNINIYYLMKKYLYFLLSFFLIILIPLFITEISLRYIGLGDPIRYDSNYIYGYSPKINQNKQRLKNSKVTINKSGLRSIDKWDQDKKKILFIGDSITYGGSYIDDKELFSHLVCLEEEKTVCGNAGVNAYSIINMVYRSKYDIRLSNADVVIFLVAPGDFYREYANAQSAHFYLNNKDFALPAITEAISFFATKYDINRYISKKNDSKTDNIFDLIDLSIELLNNEITRLEKNKEVLIFYTIEKNDPNSKNILNSYIYQNLKKNLKIKFVDLSSTLDNSIYFYDNVHFTKEGHAAVSQKILSTLKFGIN